MDHRLKWALALPWLLAQGCQCGQVASEEDARLAYLGFDQGVSRALALGLQGYNAASSANIPEQRGEGEESGEMRVSGQVDQGSSANKGLRLDVRLDDYSDEVQRDEDDREVRISYSTAEGDPLYIELKLRDLPSGDFSGTVDGSLGMKGDLEGEIELQLVLSGDLEEDPDSAGEVRRAPGTTDVSGSATSDYGTYDVDMKI